MDFSTFYDYAFAEDVGNGDHSSLACIPKTAQGKAQLLVKGNGVLAGMKHAQNIFQRFKPELKFTPLLTDGDQVKVGDIAFTIEGSSQAILTLERLVLNIMQRMSGIATYTHKLQNIVDPFGAKVLDTRKTTPGFRAFEKEAVAIGGGKNHRIGLYDMVMLKDNHIDFAGGITPAMQKVQHYLQEKNIKLETIIEARSIAEVKEILENDGVKRVLLDNFSIAELKEAVKLVNGKIETEASGGITEKTLQDVASTGVNYISIGALTHSYTSLDLSLKAV